MGRENTIQWLASIEAKPEDNEEESDQGQESSRDWNGSSLREDQRIAWLEVDDPRQRSWKQSAIYFWQSQKGRELSMGSSIVFALSLTVVGLAITLADALTEESEDVVDQGAISRFFLVLFIASIIAMTILMVLGICNKLSVDKGHKAHSNTFMKAGMTVLASGGVVYKGLVVAMSGMRPGCSTQLENTKVIFAAIFIIIQVGFLFKHSAVRINFSLPMTLVSRIMLMLVIATNLCIWFNTIVEETLHEIHINGDAEDHSVYILAEDPSNGNDSECETRSDDLDTLTGPYLFPLLIEFCVVASTMMLGIWEKSGLGLKVNEKIKKAKRDRIVAFTGIDPKDCEEEDVAEAQTEAVTTSGSTQSEHNTLYHKNSNTGFLLGWLVLLSSVVVVIVGLYNAYSSFGNEDILIMVTYASNLAFTLAGFVALPIAFQQMSVLTHKDEGIKAERRRRSRGKTCAHLHVPENKVSIARRLDKGLITVTFYALLAFKLMCMIAGYEKGDWLLFCDGVVCIFMALIQSTFIAWYAFEKRTTKEIHRATKPGRQALEFLRCCNLALWLVNTFLLKNYLAKATHNNVFGHEAWVIISNIVQPLTILYYFHCTMCLAEIIHLCYTAKYIGIVRKSKQMSESPYNSKTDLSRYSTSS